FGYVQAEVIGRPLDLLLAQRLQSAHRRHVAEFAQSPDVARTMGQRREVSGRRKDGSEFPAEASISKLALGNELVFTVILRDITERKHTEQVTRESEDRFRWMADAIPEVIWFTSLEPEKVLYVSPSFERVWGLPVEDLYQNPRLWAEIILPED